MSYFDVKDPVPEGHIMVPGKMLSITARTAKIWFRLAYRKAERGEGCNKISMGLLIREEDKPALDAALARQAARKAHEKLHCNPKTRS
jgi:hypothetical protein